MDPFSNNSEQQSDTFSIPTERPKNRNKFTHRGLCISSDFPGGNLHSVLFRDDIIVEGRLTLLVEFYGNSDTNSDTRDKSWFYFGVVGVRDSRNMKYSQILFRWKNANIYRKFLRDKKYRPYVAVRENREKGTNGNCNEWKTLYITKFTQPIQNQAIQAEFIYKMQPSIDKITFASNLAYNLNDFQLANRKIIECLDTTRNSHIYYHRQIIAESVDGHPVYMLTITSTKNIASYNSEEPQLWSYKGQRPYLMKKKPEIVITARVHPSEVSSSYCVEGIIEALVRSQRVQFLLHAFIFRIVPIVNVDGVENGHYRLDNYSQNLNRFYGHSDPLKAPSIYAIEKLITNLRQKSQLFMFLDIHGHNSPKPSFIFGNYSQNFYQTLENRTFARILQVLNPEQFSFLQCQFSKRNMSVKQRYDEHSKEASARVFAYQGSCNSECQRPQLNVQHSYTLQIHPYIASKVNAVTLPVLATSPKSEQPSSGAPVFSEIVKQYKKIGENFLIAILELLGANPLYKLAETEDCSAIRKKCLKEVLKLPQFYDRIRKQRQRQKQLNRDLFERYYKKWNISDSYRQFLAHYEDNQVLRQKMKECPIGIIEGEITKKDSLRRISPTRLFSNQSQMKSKQKLYKKEKSQLLMASDKEDLNQMKQICLTEELDHAEDPAINGVDLGAIKMYDKMENFYINSIRSSPRLVNYTPSFSPDKKTVKNQIKNPSQLQKRVKRLIFRHKTEIQTKQSTQTKKYVLRFDTEKQFQSGKVLFEGQYPFVRNLEPLSKKKSKIVRTKADSSYESYKYNLNNILFRQNSQRKETSTQLKSRVVSSDNPKIQQLLKRVSFQRGDQKSLDFNDHDLAKPINRIKGTKNILSNLILLKTRNKNPAKSLTNAQKQDIIHSISNNIIIYDTNHSLIPLMHQSKVYQQLNEQSINGNVSVARVGLAGSYRSISPIPKKELERGGMEEKEFKQITSMELFRKNNQEFLDKAKQEISEKKKIFKSIEQPQ